MKLTSFTAMVLTAGLATLSTAQPVRMNDANYRGFNMDQNGIDQKLGNILPLDAEFTTEYGKKVKLGDLLGKGRPVILNPVWYGCEGTCVLAQDGLVKSFIAMKKDQPGKGYDVITFSIKPTETPDMAMEREQAILAIYNKPGVAENWHFLTGDLANITRLTAAIGFRYQWNPTLNKINHPSGIVIATSEGKISNYAYGVEYPGKLVVRYLDMARKGDVAKEPAPVVLLGCMEWDPNTGSYRLIMWRAVQIGGTATVIIMACAIAFMTYRYRQPMPTRSSRGGGQDS